MADGKPARGLRERLREARSADPALFWVRAGLAAAIAICILRLLLGDNPWTGGVAERLADRKPLRPLDYARTWGWWTTAGIGPVLALLWASAPRWLTRGPAPETVSLAPPPRPAWFVALTAAAVLAGGLAGLPRMTQSLFEDERENLQFAIDGFFYRDHKTGELRHHQTTWSDAFFWYKEPSNHIVYSVLARASIQTWRAVARPRHAMVSEAALRVPALLAGMASIAALALLLWRLGHPAAGVVGAWILALHPWHLRYLSEARVYSLTLLLLSASLIALVKALHRGTWGRWMVYGALQFLLLWSYPATLYFVGLMNAGVAGTLLLRHRGTPALWQQGARWGIACLGGGLLFAHFMVPCLAQVGGYFAREIHEVMDVAWYRDVASDLLEGMTWGRPGPNPAFHELSDFAAEHPAVVWTTVVVALGLLAIGTLRLLAAGGVRALLVALVFVPPAASVAVAAVRGGNAYLHPQYLILALPGLVMLVALGLETAVRPLGRRAGAAVMALAVLGYGAFSHDERAELRARSFQPFRESVLLTRPVLDPMDPQNARILTAAVNFPAFYYDPLAWPVTRPERLRELMAEADATGQPLYVNVGRPSVAKRRYAGVMELLTRSGRFEKVASLWGQNSRGHRRVFRYRGPLPGTAPGDDDEPPA